MRVHHLTQSSSKAKNDELQAKKIVNYQSTQFLKLLKNLNRKKKNPYLATQFDHVIK